ncbi:cytochrome P450 [Lentzea sp. BCCO 10_0061]|uniref:Cytochrome P450 n=1 Tax=Lentzea sokolovensis TaxID=3095429 RepID=A0ABU4VAV7_9PSEU|nr:cytochrome P450 [Lentzea sp. BCCO 10_0061]MDX8148932.1 cytochrome P450 [Lentzea sp. BCCO 10_0061]
MTEVISDRLPLERQNPFDPPAEVTAIRDKAPISRLRFADGHLGWLVTGYHQLREVFGSPKFSSSRENHHLLDPRFQGSDDPGNFVSQDPPDHTRMRKMLQGQFTVRRMNQLSDWIGEIVENQIKHLRSLGNRADLVKEFTLPIPSLVICAILGIDYDERHRFQEDTEMLASQNTSPEELMAALHRIRSFIGELVVRKKANPGDDMLSGLLVTGGPTDEEASNMALLLLLAGHETTANMLGLGTFALLQHPDQLKILKDEPEIIDNAVEELMRYLSVPHFGPLRTALEDVEIDGHVIKAGDTVLAHLPTANRDPKKFPGNPDELDLRREAPHHHLAFGHGIHQCLGHQLARIEMRLGLSRLFQEFPDLRLDVKPEEVPLRTDMLLYGVHSLPVTWSE